MGIAHDDASLLLQWGFVPSQSPYMSVPVSIVTELPYSVAKHIQERAKALNEPQDKYLSIRPTVEEELEGRQRTIFEIPLSLCDSFNVFSLALARFLFFAS